MVTRPLTPILYYILISSLFAITAISCVKEKDLSDTTVTITPIEGETRWLSGVVTDSLNNGISGVHVKATVENFSREILTDVDGQYRIEVPILEASDTYIIAAKDNFSSSVIQVGDNDEYQHIIEPHPGSNADSILLNFNSNDLFVVEGQFVDLNGDPLSGLYVRLWSYDPFIPHSGMLTGDDGKFTLVGQKGVYNGGTNIFTTLVSGRCRNFYGRAVDALEDYSDVGIIEIDADRETFEINFTIQSAGCEEAGMGWWTYVVEDFVGSFGGYGTKPNAIAYCNNPESKTFFVGGHTIGTSRYFAGGFYSLDDPPTDITFDYCQPEGPFCTFKLGDDWIDIVDLVYDFDAGLMTPVTFMEDTQLFIALNDTPQSRGYSSEFSYEAGHIKSLTLVHNGQTYTMDEEATNYYFFNDLLYQGNTTGNIAGTVKTVSGQTIPYDIQLRVVTQ